MRDATRDRVGKKARVREKQNWQAAQQKAAAIAAERERVATLERNTVSVVQPGEMQPERDFNYQSNPETRQAARTAGRANRGGTGWFSFDMPVDASKPLSLVVTFYNELGLAPTMGNFDVLIDNTSIAKFAPNTAATGFWDATYAIPANLVAGKQKVTVKFQANGNGRIAPVFGVRVVRN